MIEPESKAKDETVSSESKAKDERLSSTLLATGRTSGDTGTFPQGCKFSPDGLCVLTAQCNQLMLYNTQTTATNDEWKAALKCEGGDSVRSYEWYPHMNSSDPSSCCFAGVSRDQPVHLYDAYTGTVRATYRPYNSLDEMESPTTVCFANNGQQIVMGGFRTERMLQVFDLGRPGRDASTVLRLGKTRRSKDGQKGLVSALASASESGILAVGAYSPGSIYLYDLRAQSTQVAEVLVSGTCVVGHGKAHSRKRKHFADEEPAADALNFSAAKVKWYQSRARGGVTQLEFAQDYQYIYSASRRSNAILQWDLRRLSTSSFCPGVASYETDSNTNQRIEFSLKGDQLWVGGRDKCIRVYDQKCPDSVVDTIKGFHDVVNGVSLTQLGERSLLAVACGSRHFPTEDEWELDNPHQSLVQATQGTMHIYDVEIQPSS